MFKMTENLALAIMNKEWNFDLDENKSIVDNVRSNVVSFVECLFENVVFDVKEDGIDISAESIMHDVGEGAYPLGSISYADLFEGVIENAEMSDKWAGAVRDSLRAIADKIDAGMKRP